MHELKKTAIFVAVAALLMATAALATRPVNRPAEEFNDQGQPFFPDFTPEDATTLEVVEFDQETGSPLPFKVTLKDGRWVIPSHYDYPADAQDRLAKTASWIIGLTKDAIRSDRPEDHKAMGVLDPLDPKATSPDGLGKRVTLRDRSDKVLADLIIGKPVPDNPEQRFVRRPDQNRVYGVKLDNAELSTRFSDWIETNLLKLQPSEIRVAVFDNHKIDPERQTLDVGEFLTAQRKDATSDWTMEGLAPGEQLNKDVMSTLTSTLADLKIVGVRPKPPGLTAELKAADENGISLSPESRASLASKGFHLIQGRLLSNEGDLYVTEADGVVYILRFGEVTFARGEALTAGSKEPTNSASAKPAATSESAEKPEGAVESRYLFVTAQFDPEIIPKPIPPKTDADSELPIDVFQRTAEERQAKTKELEKKAEDEKTEYQRKLDEGRKRAKELSDRFAPWYYVVPGDAYRKLVLDRKALTRAATPATGPNGPNPFTLPGMAPGGDSPIPPPVVGPSVDDQ